MSDPQPNTEHPNSPQRSSRPRCGAKARNHEGSCKQIVRKGAKRCRFHGGASPKAERAARRRAVEVELSAELAKVGVTPVGDPFTAISTVAAEIIAWKDLAAVRVAALKDDVRYETENGEQLRAEVALYERAMDRCVTVLNAIARLDIDDRLAKISEKQADMVEKALDAALAKLDLTAEQRQLAWAEVGRHLRLVS